MVIAGGQRGHTVPQILEQFQNGFRRNEIGLSVVTIVELIHGVERAGIEERRQRRQAFVDELIRHVPVHQGQPALDGNPADATELLAALDGEADEDKEEE